MPNGRVLVHLGRPREFLDTHEGHALLAVARTLARLKEYEFVEGDADEHGPGAHRYVVPDETLLAGEATALGIGSPHDLFGGVVPHEFVRTKAIAHPLVDDGAACPRGWSTSFTERVCDVVLPGFTAFDRRDVLRAASALLSEGPIRLKRPRAAGGRGQRVASSVDEVARFAAELPDEELRAVGLVLEADLDDVRTVSVGQIVFGDLVVSYHGHQQLTRDNEGRAVYGGSVLSCVRGDWSVLERSRMPADLRRAVVQARRFDAATEEYGGLIVSRRNYDVGQGVDGRGRWRSGVLEQGWRCGGASGAEAIALEEFTRDPTRCALQVAAVERYGEALDVPRGAVVHFHGVDPACGPMVRYAIVDAGVARAA
jgi:hypothetical protein